jgi:hypothetical protein
VEAEDRGEAEVHVEAEAAAAGDVHWRAAVRNKMSTRRRRSSGGVARRLLVIALACAALAASASCSREPASREPARPAHRTFATPEAAVEALIAAVKKGDLPEVVAIFGQEGKELIDSSDSVSARRNREIFTAAVAQRWQLEKGETNGMTLVIGDEAWPFPIPLVKDANGWRFDTAAGKEEVLARRIGRNELAVIAICRTYVAAQQIYARRGHDGKPAGLYARTFRSDQGRENGLYWHAARGQKRSPLGDLLTEAALESRSASSGSQQPAPFHGYRFKILTAQGDSATGGAKDYIVNGEMSGGFALVAWPAQYDVTGIMTFVVNQEGVVHEKDLGPETAAIASEIVRYDPDQSWGTVQ